MTAHSPRDEIARSAMSVAELVGWLRERIRAGLFAPGQRLIEPDLVRETASPRARVREALQRLESEGLVVLEEFRGASVRSFSPAETRQIYRTRMALEGLAAHDCAILAAAPVKAEISALQEEMNACEHTGDHNRFARLNDAWHDAIIAGADNAYVATFVSRLRVPLYRLLFSTFYEPERIDDANAGHRKITAAIVTGDAARAERLMRSHIAEAMEVAVRLESDIAV
jgi:DNA-binding GntR family transcriptional regulator